VEARRHPPRVEAQEPVGQGAVEACAERGGVEVGAHREAHHLPQGMHPRVGACGHRERRPHAGGGEGGLERVLHRGEPGLVLEAAEPAPLVEESESVEAPFHAW
jgi:hypothetical protein